MASVRSLTDKFSCFCMSGCNITTMTDNRPGTNELWYRASAKNTAIFALLWSGEAFLILMFIKRVIHGSAALYLLMVPWTLLGLTMVVLPNWIVRVTRAWEKSLERVGENLEKRPPPGFP